MISENAKMMYPLAAALEVAGVKPGQFHRHFYGGVLGKALVSAGEIADHITKPMRGAGVGRGGSRFVTVEGAIFLAVFFHQVSAGVNSQHAVLTAQKFTFLGESGSGIRAFKSGRPRPPGAVFSGKDDTFLVSLVCAAPQNGGEGEGIAFVQEVDLTAPNLKAWLGVQDADANPVCIFNLSELCKGVRSNLSNVQGRPLLSGTDDPLITTKWPATTSDPINAFLNDCTERDEKSRVPTREFFGVFAAWYAGWTGQPLPELDGKRATNTTLQLGLEQHGIRKLKSNGIMTFAGFRWSDTPQVQNYLTLS